MKIIRNETLQKELEEKSGIQALFDTEELAFQLISYQSGEVVSSPMCPNRDLLFLVKGRVQIYGIRADGGKRPVTVAEPVKLFGDLEFISGQQTVFYAETIENCLLLKLSLNRYRKKLDTDIRFLRFLLQYMSDLLIILSHSDAFLPSLEERLTDYLSSQEIGYEFKGVELLTMKYQCSRRQLQRVLKKLCEKGILRRVAKGHYRLERI